MQTNPLMKTCYEQCKAHAEEGKIGTPWCAKFSKCECHNSQPVVPEWEKEFENQFCRIEEGKYLQWKNFQANDANMIPCPNEIKTFFRQIVQEIRNATLEQAAEAVRSIEFRSKGTEEIPEKYITRKNAFNQGIEDAQTTIRQLKSK